MDLLSPAEMSIVHAGSCNLQLPTPVVLNSISCNDKKVPAEVTVSPLSHPEATDSSLRSCVQSAVMSQSPSAVQRVEK